MRVRKEVIGFILIIAVSLFTNITLAASISGRLIDQISKEPVGTWGWLDLYMYKEEYHYPWAHIADTRPDSDGNFSFLGLGAGTYVIHGECSGYHSEWYDDVQGSKGAPLVVVRAAIERATHIVLGEEDEVEVTVDLLPKLEGLRKRLPKSITPEVWKRLVLEL